MAQAVAELTEQGRRPSRPPCRSSHGADGGQDHRTSTLAAPQARRLTSHPDEDPTPLTYAASYAGCADDQYFHQIILGK